MNITFRPSSPEYAERFYQLRQDVEHKKFNPILPSTIDELKVRLAKTSSDWLEFEKSESLFWFLELNGQIAGTVVFKISIK